MGKAEDLASVSIQFVMDYWLQLFIAGVAMYICWRLGRKVYWALKRHLARHVPKFYLMNHNTPTSRPPVAVHKPWFTG